MALKVVLLLCLLSLTLQIQKIDCDVQGCLSCNSPNVCEICESNLILTPIEGSPFSVCIEALDQTQNLNIDSLSAQRILQTCLIASCKMCNQTNMQACQTCNPGFFVDPTNAQCRPCGVSCTSCVSAQNCTVCNTGFVRQPDGSCKMNCTVTGC